MPNGGGPPIQYPFRANRTLASNTDLLRSWLNCVEIKRFTDFEIEPAKLEPLEKLSAQYRTSTPADRHRNS